MAFGELTVALGKDSKRGKAAIVSEMEKNGPAT